MKRKLIPVVSRVPEDLYNQLKEHAQEEQRAVSKQVVYIVKQYFENNKEEKMYQ